jgi:hypothetical protein
MAARLARDIPEGWYVNLGLGLPTLIPDYIPEGREVVFHSENGVLGMGPVPPKDQVDTWLVNATKQNITLVKGASLFHHADSFGMIRGGHLDLCVLGAYEVAENGDIANWATSQNDAVPAVGGAMDPEGDPSRAEDQTDSRWSLGHAGQSRTPGCSTSLPRLSFWSVSGARPSRKSCGGFCMAAPIHFCRSG